MRGARLPWFVLLALLAAPAHAATVLEAVVTHDDGRYSIKFDVRVQAPLARVLAVITDYERYSQLSDTVVERRLLATRTDGSQRVLVTFRACVWFFCKTMRKTTDVQQLPNGDVFVLTDPAESDFRFGREHWHLEPEDSSTRIQYQAVLVPAFFIPPLIGPWLVKSRMADEVEITANRIEEIAQAVAR